MLPDFFSFVLFFVFSRPRAGLATVSSSFCGLATSTLNVRNNRTTFKYLVVALYLQPMQYVIYYYYHV